MQHISVFDIMKIGIGPSSSNTMGPWRASQRFLEERCADGTFADIQHIQFELFGSLAKTGLGHGTDIAVLMGLRGEDPATCDTLLIEVKVQQIRAEKKIWLLQVCGRILERKSFVKVRNINQQNLEIKTDLIKKHGKELRTVSFEHVCF